MNRRNFLTYSTSLASLPFIGDAVYALPRQKQQPKSDKSVVFLFLGGGMSHIESTHADPNLPQEYRSVNGELQTKIPGNYIGGLWEGVAKNSDKFTFVKSYRTLNNNHQNSTYYNVTGRPNNLTFQTDPSIGSMITKVIGPNNPYNGMPHYAKINGIDGDSAVWLGSLYNAFEANDRGIRDLTLNISEEQLSRRTNILSIIEQRTKWMTGQAWSDALKVRHQALDMIRKDIKKAFEIKHESEETMEKYGKNFIGDGLLLSRRLIENGSRYISLSYGGFDLHQGIKVGMERLVPNMDKAISCFLNEIEERGMSKNVMLVVCTDFGRTVKINGTAGRDHHGNVVPLMIAGGEYEHGRVIGKTDKIASVVEESPFTPEDLCFTIMNHFGINANQMIMTTPAGRPITASNGKLIL
jgi:uncharacterized protein (DUF1501 family)